MFFDKDRLEEQNIAELEQIRKEFDLIGDKDKRQELLRKAVQVSQKIPHLNIFSDKEKFWDYEAMFWERKIPAKYREFISDKLNS